MFKNYKIWLPIFLLIFVGFPCVGLMLMTFGDQLSGTVKSLIAGAFLVLGVRLLGKKTVAEAERTLDTNIKESERINQLGEVTLQRLDALSKRRDLSEEQKEKFANEIVTEFESER